MGRVKDISLALTLRGLFCHFVLVQIVPPSDAGVRGFFNNSRTIHLMGTHEKLKTPEEHEVIMERLLKNRMLNPSSRRNIFPLSGLLYSKKCGLRMRFRVGENKKQGQHWK